LRFIFMLRCIPKILKRRVALQELLFLHKVVLLVLVKGWGGLFVLIMVVVEVLVFSVMKTFLLFFYYQCVSIFYMLKVPNQWVLTQSESDCLIDLPASDYGTIQQVASGCRRKLLSLTSWLQRCLLCWVGAIGV
jgi:hypothetical protein